MANPGRSVPPKLVDFLVRPKSRVGNTHASRIRGSFRIKFRVTKVYGKVYGQG